MPPSRQLPSLPSAKERRPEVSMLSGGERPLANDAHRDAQSIARMRTLQIENIYPVDERRRILGNFDRRFICALPNFTPRS